MDSKKITANFFANSLDLLFPNPVENHTGIGFLLGNSPFFGQDIWHISVFDKNGTEMLKADVPPGPQEPNQEPNKGFFGVWCERSIGRINICGLNNTLEFVDDIQMWEESPIAVEPATWGSIKSTYR